MARECSTQFVGFQISHWSCYHIDELDDLSGAYLPISLDKIKNKSLSELLGELDLCAFMQRIAHHSCSLIRDTKIERTIQRIELLISLCNDDNFLKTFTTRLIKLQKQKGIFDKIIIFCSRNSTKLINKYFE